jgi:hypothetical protein
MKALLSVLAAVVVAVSLVEPAPAVGAEPASTVSER